MSCMSPVSLRSDLVNKGADSVIGIPLSPLPLFIPQTPLFPLSPFFSYSLLSSSLLSLFSPPPYISFVLFIFVYCFFFFFLAPYVYGSKFADTFTPQTQFWDVAKKVRESIIQNKDKDIQMNGMLSFVRYFRLFEERKKKE